MRLLIIFALLLIAGCSHGSALQSRAAAYYNFMAGHAPNRSYIDFLSPAYREQFNQESLKELEAAMQRPTTANRRRGVATAADILVTLEDRFAFTVADPAKERAFRDMPPLRWVKVGRQWYLYLGANVEESSYGQFPPALKSPEPEGWTEVPPPPPEEPYQSPRPGQPESPPPDTSRDEAETTADPPPEQENGTPEDAD